MDYSDFIQYTEKVPRGSMILAPGYDSINPEILYGDAIGLFLLCFVVSTIIGVVIAILVINKDDDIIDGIDDPFNPNASYVNNDDNANDNENNKNETTPSDDFMSAVNSHGSIR